MNTANAKKVYFSKKLNKALDKILESRCSVVNAPFGFGKTRSVRGYLEKNEIPYVWIDCTASKEVFWVKYCDAIMTADAKIAEKIRKLGYPDTSKKLADFAEIMKNLKGTQNQQKNFLVLDNYEKIEDETMDYLFLPDASYENSPFSVIIIVEGTLSREITDYTFTDKVYFINSDEFVLSPSDIREYMRGYSINLGVEKSNSIYDMTNGWILIIQACARRYLKCGDFNIEQDINRFVDRHIFQPLPANIKKLFINLGIFDEFTYSLAEAIGKDTEGITKAINDFGFLTVHDRGYYFSFHPIFKAFLKRQFEGLSFEEKSRVYNAAADYYITQGEFFYAMKFYYKCGKIESIFKMVPDFYNIYINVNNANKKFFMALADSFFDVEKNGEYRFSIMLAFIMFLYNEKDAMTVICDQIENDLNNTFALKDINLERYRAELEFVRSYLDFNDYKAMHEHYMLARSYSKLPITLLPNRFPYNFQLPSVFTLLYNEVGRMREIGDFINDTISDYYLLTYGHGKGSASLFQAELSYHTGDLKATETNCHHAIYQAESRNQFSIMIAAYMYLCRAAIMGGNYEGYISYRERMNAVYKDAVNDNMQHHIKMEIDIADAIICNLLGEHENFPEWIKNPLILERSGNLITLCYTFNLHAGYLYSIGEYVKIIGISSQILSLTDLYSAPLIKLKANITIAAAYLANLDSENAIKHFRTAVELAYRDELVMPFVESYSTIELLIDRIDTTNKEINDFIKKIKAKARALKGGVGKCTKIVKNQNNHGLTPREAEIAKLAALRYSNKQIATQLFIAESTVKSALKIIFNKLGISSRRELEEVL